MMDMTYYRTDLIKFQLEHRFPGIAKAAVAKDASVCEQTMQRILRGENVSVGKLRNLTDHLGLVWHLVFDPKLKRSDFHRAVVRRSGR